MRRITRRPLFRPVSCVTGHCLNAFVPCRHDARTNADRVFPLTESQAKTDASVVMRPGKMTQAKDFSFSATRPMFLGIVSRLEAAIRLTVPWPTAKFQRA